MKLPHILPALLTLLLMTPALALAADPVANTVYDDFDNQATSMTLWETHDDLGSISFANSNVKVAPSAQEYVRMEATRTFSGDFAVILEFNNFASDAVAGTYNENYPQISLQASWDDADHSFVYIFFGEDQNDNKVIIGNSRISNNWDQSTYSFVSGNSGYLAITRTGDAIKTYYKLGDSWVEDYSTTGLTGPVEIQVGTFGDNTFSVQSDWVKIDDNIVATSSTNIVPMLDLLIMQ